jgi:hypothetical protein
MNETIQPAVRLEDSMLNYLIKGYMPLDEAAALIALPVDDRNQLVDKLNTLVDLEGGEQLRKTWLEARLGAEAINEIVFLKYVSDRPTAYVSSGMGTRMLPSSPHQSNISTNGRHSSWATTSASTSYYR